ncbi:hypothetical protein ACSZMV_21745 [Aeromonas veronii]
MSTLIFLDRNVISYMDRYSNNGSLHAAGANIIERLLALDCEGNYISIFSSLLEGGISRPKENNTSHNRRPRKEIKESILKDLAIAENFCNKFLKHAKFREVLLFRKKIGVLSSIVYTSDNDHYIYEKMRLLDDIRALLINKISFDSREKIYLKIKNIIQSKYDILKDQPFIIVVLMCLFESEQARKLLKFGSNNFFAYNTISDFNQVRFMERMKQEQEQAQKQNKILAKRIRKVELLSADSDICFISGLFNVTKMNLVENNGSGFFATFNFTLNYGLILSELSEDNNPNCENVVLFSKCFKDYYGYDIKSIFDSLNK